ncbi:MAG: hypothetical protein WCJ35_05480 [Planctomycetota bacterium]
MNEEFVPGATLPVPADDVGEMPTAENPAIETASSEYLGRWNRLISTTNWEKGRIVAEWREALIVAGAPVAAYTDDAWSQRVGSVTPQHTGRLRRVYQRFASMQDAYPGLYWSHYQAALDWDDAEMWLEGAVQNCWSISQMQGKRSRTLGTLVEESVEATAVEVDEDAAAPDDFPSSVGSASMVEARETADADSHDAETFEAADESVPFETADSYVGDEPIRPFENLPTLPADLRDAFDGFKLAIIHHRISNWQEVSIEDVLATLEALRQLVLVPAEA